MKTYKVIVVQNDKWISHTILVNADSKEEAEEAGLNFVLAKQQRDFEEYQKAVVNGPYKKVSENSARLSILVGAAVQSCEEFEFDAEKRGVIFEEEFVI